MRSFRVLSRTGSVRVRTAVAATVVVAVALALAATALVVLQRQQLQQGLATVAQQQAEEVVARIGADGIDAVDVSALSASAGERALVQVVDPSGDVVAASVTVDGEAPVSSATPGAGVSVVQTLNVLPIGEDEPYVVVVTGVRTDQGVGRVITAQSLETVQRSTTIIVSLIAIGYPLVLIVVAITCYWLAGRALAPVEAIRRRVGEVSAVDLSARVPVPDSGDEIARLAVTMNSMLARLQASADSQRRFVADASHELRSPLATIRATAEVAGAHPEALDWRAAAGSVLAETDRLERLVADLLLLARADEDGLAMRVEDVDLDDVVTNEAARLRRLAALDVVVDVRSVRVRGDLQHLARAVRNLTDNAARYATTTVALQLRAVEGLARIEVVDDGPGIPQAEHQRVFERFVRLDASRDRAAAEPASVWPSPGRSPGLTAATSSWRRRSPPGLGSSSPSRSPTSRAETRSSGRRAGSPMTRPGPPRAQRSLGWLRHTCTARSGGGSWSPRQPQRRDRHDAAVQQTTGDAGGGAGR